MKGFKKDQPIKYKDFNRILAEIVNENIPNVLTIPEVQAILSTYFRDEILARWDREQFGRKANAV